MVYHFDFHECSIGYHRSHCHLRKGLSNTKLSSLGSCKFHMVICHRNLLDWFCLLECRHNFQIQMLLPVQSRKSPWCYQKDCTMYLSHRFVLCPSKRWWYRHLGNNYRCQDSLCLRLWKVEAFWKSKQVCDFSFSQSYSFLDSLIMNKLIHIVFINGWCFSFDCITKASEKVIVNSWRPDEVIC